MFLTSYHPLISFHEIYNLFSFLIPHEDVSTITTTDNVFTVVTKEVNAFYCVDKLNLLNHLLLALNFFLNRSPLLISYWWNKRSLLLKLEGTYIISMGFSFFTKPGASYERGIYLPVSEFRYPLYTCVFFFSLLKKKKRNKLLLRKFLKKGEFK